MLQELDRGGPNRYAFSFSGLKTAVLRAVRERGRRIRSSLRPSGTGSISPEVSRMPRSTSSPPRPRMPSKSWDTDGDDRWRRGLQSHAGGAAGRAAGGTSPVSVASPRLNTDNAAMIAAAGAWRLARGERSGWDLEPRDDLPLPGLTVTKDAE